MDFINCIICDSEESTDYLTICDRLTTVPKDYYLVKCKCNFVYLNPRPDKTSIYNYYKTKDYDPHNASFTGIWNKLYHFIQYFTLCWKYNKIHSIYKSGRLLDIGGGQGEFASFMTSKGWNVVMQDILIAQTKNNGNSDYKFIDDLKKIKENEIFDVVTLWHSLEHIHDIQDLFKQINRLLTPSGVVFIAVPNLHAPDRKLFGSKWAAFDAPRHLYHFHPESLKRLCRKYDFQLIRKFSLFQDTPYNILLSISINNIFQLLKAAVLLIISSLQTIIRGPGHSSSFLIICKKS